MKPDEPTVVTNQDEGGDGWNQVPLWTGARQYYRVGITRPVEPPAGGALEAGASGFEGGCYPFEIVLTPVAFHGEIIP